MSFFALFPLFFFAYCVSIFDSLRYPIFLFHLRYHLCKLFFAFFDAAGVDVSGDSFAVHDWRVPSFPHVLADLMNRACSLPSVLAFIRLKFRSWRGFGCFGRYLLVLALTALKLGVRACKRSYRSVNGLGCSSHSFVGSMGVHV